MYWKVDDSNETIPENPGIRRFVWGHFENLNRVVQRMKYCGEMFSGPKLYLCVPKIFVLGHRCTPEGQLPDELRVSAIQKWGPCQSLSEVCAFLGMVGVVQIFIKNFSLRTHPLIKLTQKDEPFIFGPEQIQAQEDLKATLVEPPALHAIDYTLPAPIILAVNTSYIVVSSQLCQCDVTTPSRHYYN
jgi:hypothetical protein